MNLYEITTKLNGPISSVGESNEDARRLVNLEDAIELVDKLVADISEAARSKDYPEASRAKIGRKAHEFLNDLRDSL